MPSPVPEHPAGSNFAAGCLGLAAETVADTIRERSGYVGKEFSFRDYSTTVERSGIAPTIDLSRSGFAG